jgi:REP element-mobilizing transposase RayT
VSEDATFFITINCQERGKNHLAHESIARGIFEAIEFYHLRRQWQVDLAVVMPDHLHALISFKWDSGNGMMNLVRNWKRFTANKLGVVWQRDYFDHRIRSEQDMQSTWYYIRENPVRARLVDSFDQWPHVWRPEIGIGW